MQSLHAWLTLPSWKLCNSLHNVAFFQCHRAGTAPFAASPPECRGNNFCCCQCSQKVISLCVVWYLISVLISLKTQRNKGTIQFECVQFHHEGLTKTTKVLQSQELKIQEKLGGKGNVTSHCTPLLREISSHLCMHWTLEIVENFVTWCDLYVYAHVILEVQ